jgi:prolyl-tRNA editing enzyme YbaK/EbsC (Cys-tRNA(Pro) deacylase)
MRPATHANALRVQAALGDGFTVVEFEISTRTAAEAASAIGCEVAQIAKSIVFRAVRSGRAVLVIASGINRVDEQRVAGVIGEAVARADPEFVKENTGYTIGGVPPLAIAQGTAVLLDRDLGRHAQIWAAAGTPNAVFSLTWDDLVRLTGGVAADIAQSG